MAKSNVTTKPKGSFFAISVSLTDDTAHHNELKTMMWDIAEAMDDEHSGCIQIPSRYSSSYRTLYNEANDYPFFYYSSENMYGICVDTGTFTVSQVKHMFKKYKEKHNLNFTMYLSYNFFDTFWMPYSGSLVGFTRSVDECKTKFINERKRTFVI